LCYDRFQYLHLEIGRKRIAVRPGPIDVEIVCADAPVILLHLW
jgi:hypothetical protein